MSSQGEHAAGAVIIGAGVMGCSIALELSRRGRSVVVVDRRGAAGAGSTSASSAVVRFSYSTPTGVHLSWEGVQYWKRWDEVVGDHDELGRTRFVDCGQLLMLQEPGDFAHVVLDLWEQLDIPHERLTPEQIGERWPWIDLGVYGPPALPDDDAFWADAKGRTLGGCFSPDSGYVADPQLAAHNLQRAAEAHGAEFRFGQAVVAIERSADAVTGLTLADGTRVMAPLVVNAAGPHSGAVNAMAGLDGTMAIGTTPLRQEVHHVPAPAGVDMAADGMVLGDLDLGFYSRPETGNHVLLGGMEPECDELEWLDDPDVHDEHITDLWQTQVLRASRRFPDLGMPHQRKGIVGVYDVSDDWMPIYDRTDLDGFFVAIGTSGNQFKNAGVVGHLMAELIAAVESGHDHDADPITVHGRFTGRPIEMRKFARNRELDTESSMSVNG